jgi:DNA-3-methyladenine glycosylase
MRRLKRAELPVETSELARYLIGKFLVRESASGRLSGRIVETEAYLVGDAAAHSYRGMTERNRSLFLGRGHSYVYFIYGMWHCMNVSGDREGIGAGVLLRALEPVDGIGLMRRAQPRLPDHRLASGPGRLATALSIDRSLDGINLCAKGRLWLGIGPSIPGSISIGVSTRIGISKDAHRLLRFYERGNKSVSGPRLHRA